MKTIKKALALVVALCVMVSLASVSAFAADYTPTYSYNHFFEGSSGEGFLKTEVDYDNDGEKEDYYVAYGLNGYYTSIDGVNWDMRSQISNIRSMAYGNDVGIALLAKGSRTVYLSTGDLNFDSTVHNKLAGENAKWIELHPNIYFDELSGLFFCHGFEYETTAPTTYTDIGLYYTDGSVSPMTYGEQTTNALTWSEVTGDLFTGDSIATDTYKYMTREKIGIMGDSYGNILVSYHSQTNSSTHTTNPKTVYSFVKTTEGKNVTASRASTKLTKYLQTAQFANSPNSFYINGNVVVLGVSSSKSYYSVGTISDTAVDLTATQYYNADKAFEKVFNSGNAVYITKGGDIYKTTFTADKKLQLLETNEDGTFKSITEGIYDKLNNSGYSVQDMLFLDDGSIVLMVNATGTVKAYLLRLVTDADGVITSTQLTSDATYTHFTGTGSDALTDTTARGYKVNAGFRAYSTLDGKGYPRDGFTATLSGEGSEYFEGATSAYTDVSKNAPAGRYTINYFLKIDNQPSIFTTKTAVYDVVPRFTTAVNGGEAADEAYTAQLTAGENTVTVTLDDLERYVVKSSDTYDATLNSSFLVMGARYNSNHQMQEVVRIYDTAKLTEGSATPFEFNVTNAADGDYMKVFILEGLSTIKPLW